MYLFLALSISIAVVSCGNKKDKEETKKAEIWLILKRSTMVNNSRIATSILPLPMKCWM